MTKLTYIIPTIGRECLRHVVDGVLPQLTPEDELFVVGDGPQDLARKIMWEHRRSNVFYLEWGPTNNYGGAQIDYATQLARGDFIVVNGDDDGIPEGAIEGIREEMGKGEPQACIFSMRHGMGILRNSITSGRVSGQQIVVPNQKDRLPKWGDYSGPVCDHKYIAACVGRFPIKYSDVVVSIFREGREKYAV